MGVSSNTRAEIAGYQLKVVAQTWYVQWRDNRSLKAGPISWEVFRRAFLDRFFPRGKRKAKVKDFINLHQGGMSVIGYSLKFTKLSKYASSLVSNPKDEINLFVMGVSDYLVEEFHLAVLHYNMDMLGRQSLMREVFQG